MVSPGASSEVAKLSGLSKSSVWKGLRRCWENGYVLRSEEPVYESVERFRGRKGIGGTLGTITSMS